MEYWRDNGRRVAAYLVLKGNFLFFEFTFSFSLLFYFEIKRLAKFIVQAVEENWKK